jgi:uncharacterized protein YndB with AHSA1/START domain
MKKIIHFVRIHAAPEKVYASLTDESGLRSWWSTGVDINQSENVIHFHFAGDFNPDMKVTKLDPNRLVEWQCIAGHKNWQENTFSFELREVSGETGLMFTQIYAQELSDEVYGTYNFNWGYYLQSLKLLAETGIGTPFKAAGRAAYEG